MQAKKGRGNLHIQGCTALLQIWACEHLGIGQKNAEINQPFPRFLSMDPPKNVLSVLVAMPWEQQKSMWYKQPWRPCKKPMAARTQAITPILNGAWRMSLNHVKGLVATVLESSPTIQQNLAPILTKRRPSQNQPPTLTKPLEQNQPPVQTELPIQTPIVDLPSSPSKAVPREANLPKRRPRQPWWTWQAHHQSGTMKGRQLQLWWIWPNEVDSNEVAISTETYEITGRDVSSLLGDQAQDDGSRWISTAVVDTFKDVLMQKLIESGHPPPYINFIISVHGGTTILGIGSSQPSGQRGKRTRKGKQPVQDDQPQTRIWFPP
uniref:Aminotransferase-like plant mobile domain-containing protein n=1 Tax=Fagus sylvatica TaxID=28930 RepID=A0A2N9I9S9_FAGSY